MSSTWEIDKSFFLLLNGSDSVVMDNFALTETHHFAWIPFVLILLYIIIKNNSFKKTLFILILLLVLYLSTDILVANLIQPYFGRLRPAMDLSFVNQVDLVNGSVGGIHCLISHQASKLMGFSIFLSLLFRSIKFFICSLCWTVLHSYVLVYLGHYFPLDILLGWIWGLILSFFLYMVYLKVGSKIFEIRYRASDQCTTSGYFKFDMTFGILIWLLNLACILIISFIID